MTGIPLTETYVFIITTALTLGTVLLSSSGRHRGILAWSMASYLHAGTYVVLLLCPAEAAPLGLLAATLAYSAGTSCLLYGLGQFVGRPIARWTLWLPPLLIVLSAPLADAWPEGRALWRGPILIGQLAGLLWFLVRHRDSLPGAGKVWLALGLAVITGIHVARVFYAATLGIDGWPMVSMVPSPPLAEIGPKGYAAFGVALMLPLMIGMSSLVIVKDHLQQQTATTQAFMQTVFDSIPHQFCVIERSGRIITTNRAWLDFAKKNGGDPKRLGIGANYLQAVRTADPRIEAGIRDVLDRRAAEFSAEYPCHAPDRKRWFLMRVAPLDDPRGKAVISHTEITSQKELDLLREQSLTLFRDIASSVPGILFKVREQPGTDGKPMFDFMSPAIADLGLEAQAVVEDADLLLSLVHPADLALMMSSVRHCAADRAAWRAEFRLRQRDGGFRWFEGRAVPEAEEADGTIVWYGYFHDIQDSKDAQERIRVMAQRDSLTGLPNRHLFDERLAQTMAAARREGYRMGLLFIDLDRFKPVNDQHGHEMGDLLLCAVAERLRLCLRDADTPARIGGDEFVVLLHRVGDERDVQAVAAKISARLAEPFLIRDVVLTIGSSIGWSVFPDDGDDAATLIAQADRGMYTVKQRGARRG